MPNCPGGVNPLGLFFENILEESLPAIGDVVPMVHCQREPATRSGRLRATNNIGQLANGKATVSGHTSEKDPKALHRLLGVVTVRFGAEESIFQAALHHGFTMHDHEPGVNPLRQLFSN